MFGDCKYVKGVLLVPFVQFLRKGLVVWGLWLANEHRKIRSGPLRRFLRYGIFYDMMAHPTRALRCLNEEEGEEKLGD
jgi:hypothetical protein